MAQDAESDGPSQSGQQGRDALKALIAEGLNLSAQLADQDIVRYRRLLGVLFEACILKHPQDIPSQSTIEQSHLTITILLRQINAQPSLLHHLPPPPELPMPLYKWLMPRLMTAAAYCVPTSDTNDLFDAFVSAAGRLIALLRKEEVNSVSDGAVHVLSRHLTDFCQGELS